MKSTSFIQRIITGLVAIPLVLLLIWHPVLKPGFALLVGAIAAIGLYEYYAIVRARAISPETIGGIIAGTLVSLSGYLENPVLTNWMLYGGCLLVSLLHIVRGQHSVAGLASSVFGVFYIGWFSAHALLLHRDQEMGPALVTMLFIAVTLTDTMAYFAGSLIGRHKMAPLVSPKKSWEGAIVGFLSSLAGMVLLYYLRERFAIKGLPDWPLWTYLGTGALLSFVAQVGDLTESCLKRDAGVKDSGGLFPGHGGVLDRCDGFLFATPVLYYIWA